jgi:hypothetical protein
MINQLPGPCPLGVVCICYLIMQLALFWLPLFVDVWRLVADLRGFDSPSSVGGSTWLSRFPHVDPLASVAAARRAGWGDGA